MTDCQAFAMTMNKKNLCLRVHRWALFLALFKYTIEHRPGRSLSHVDAPSRNPLPEVMLNEECENSIIARLIRAQRKDENLRGLLTMAENEKNDDFTMKNGLLYKIVNDDDLIVVPRSMQSQVIRQAHERGHFAINKTEAILKREYWFQGMRSKVEKVVRNCINCILAERKQGKQEGLLNSIKKGEGPLDTFHVDHLDPLPSTKKSYNHIFVVINGFTKFVWLYATKSTSTVEVVQHLKKQSTIFGNPQRIISDRGTAFTSHDLQEYCRG